MVQTNESADFRRVLVIEYVVCMMEGSADRIVARVDRVVSCYELDQYHTNMAGLAVEIFD
jgi:hypothetical protein